MKISKPLLAAAVLMSSFGAANADIVTFEDLDPFPSPYRLMPAIYRGLAFEGWYFGPDTTYTPASGVIDLFTDFADPANPFDPLVTDSNNKISSSIAFVFSGAFFSGYSGVTFELFKDGSLVHTSDSLLDAPDVLPYGPTFLSSGYVGLIDTVVVKGVQGFYSMDDFSFTATGTSDLPEPNSLTLALLAVVASGAAGYRQRCARCEN